MLDVRTLGLGVVAFGATFAIGWWAGLGKPAAAPPPQVQAPPAATAAASQAALPELKPKLAVFAKPSAPSGPKPAVQGKGLTSDDGLRRDVILRAKAYLRPACNGDATTLYVNAATRYAEVLMRAAGCNNFPRCPIGEGNLGDVWRLNRSAADDEVARAMAAANAAGGLSDKRFRVDVGRAVRVIAGTDFNTGPAPQCESASSSNGRWRIRVRR